MPDMRDILSSAAQPSVGPPPAEGFGVPDEILGMDEVQVAEAKRERQLISDMVADFLWFEQERDSQYAHIFEDCYKNYRATRPDEKQSKEWRSKLHVPMSFTNVEEILPHMLASVVGSEQIIKVRSKRNPTQAMVQEYLCNKQLRQQMHIEQHWEEFQKQKCIYGTSHGAVGFMVSKVMRKQWEKDPMNVGQLVVKTREVIDYVGNFFETWDISEVYPHPRSTWNSRIRIYRRQYRSMAWMKKAGFDNLDKVTPDMAGNLTDDSQIGAQRRNQFGSLNQAIPQSGQTDLYEVLTRYDDEAGKITTLVGRKVKVQDEDYPWWHGGSGIVEDRYFILPKTYYGMGVIEPVLPLQHEKNSIRNQRRDAWSLTVNPIMSVRNGSIEDERTDLKSKPGQVIHRDGSKDDVDFLRPPMLPGDSLEEDAAISHEAERAIGNTPAISGTPVTDTAKGNGLMQKASIIRLQQSARRSALAMSEVGRMMVANNAQFFPLYKDALWGMVALEYDDPMPETLSADLDVEVLPTGIYGDNNIDFQELVSFSNIAMQNPAVLGDIEWKYLYKEMAKLKNLDVDKLFKTDLSIDMMDAAKALAENSFMAETGQVAPPAELGENHDLHIDVLNRLAQQRPDLHMLIGEHRMSHEQAKANKLMMMAQMPDPTAPGGGGRPNGPGSMPAGAQAGAPEGQNPNRMPQAGSSLGLARQSAAMSPRMG